MRGGPVTRKVARSSPGSGDAKVGLELATGELLVSFYPCALKQGTEPQKYGTRLFLSYCLYMPQSSINPRASVCLCSCRADVSFNSSVRLHSFLCGALGILLPCLFILSFIVNTLTPEELQELLGDGLAKALGLSMVGNL